MTIVGKSGLWKDGNELTDQLLPERNWTNNDDSDFDDAVSRDDSEDETDEDEPGCHTIRLRGGQLPDAARQLPIPVTSQDNGTDDDKRTLSTDDEGSEPRDPEDDDKPPQSGYSITREHVPGVLDGQPNISIPEFDDDSKSLASEDIQDFWECPSTNMDNEFRGYKPHTDETAERSW